MELVLDKQALIDKVAIYGFDVLSIDSMDKLVEKGVKVAKVVVKQQINLVEEHKSITIDKTDLFDKFHYSINFENHIYVHLELSMIDDGFHNLNCINADGLRDRLDQVKEFLYTEYGITVDFKNAKLNKMEINKTIVLSHPYQDYQRPLSLMMSLLPKGLRLHGEKDNQSKDEHFAKSKDKIRSIQTYCKESGKKGLTIKIYDKKEQLKVKYKIELSQYYLRFELVLNAPLKVKESLGTNTVSEITDIAINNYFSDFIKKML